MTKFIGAVLATLCVACLGSLVRAEGGKDVAAIVDKAIKALGGEEKLGAAKVVVAKSSGKINFGGSENPINTQVTTQGLDHQRSEFEGDFGGMKISGVTVLAGDKAWRKFGEMVTPLEKDDVANTKRTVYLQVIPASMLPLKNKDFKVETAGEEMVDGKPAVVLKITGPDGKDFKLSLDKESGLPVKQVAKVLNFMQEEVTQETNYHNYKDFGGVKRAAKTVIKHNGEPFMELELGDIKVLKEVDPKTFEEPK